MADSKQIIFSEERTSNLVQGARQRAVTCATSSPVPACRADVMDRLFKAAHLAPSVGLMQPWRFIRVQNDSLARRYCKTGGRRNPGMSANEIGPRKKEFLKLKLEGVRSCAELVAVVLAPDDGTILGRRTLPNETALCSAACAIENMWLAARAENIGLGWVSLFDPQRLGALLHCPKQALPIALLCIGPVETFYEKPMLVEQGWRDEKPLAGMLFTDRWQDEKVSS